MLKRYGTTCESRARGPTKNPVDLSQIWGDIYKPQTPSKRQEYNLAASLYTHRGIMCLACKNLQQFEYRWECRFGTCQLKLPLLCHYLPHPRGNHDMTWDLESAKPQMMGRRCSISIEMAGL
jgi:hypothetical protein